MRYALCGRDNSSQGKLLLQRSCLTFCSRKSSIALWCRTIKPSPDSYIISMAVGQLKVDEDLIMGFHLMFLLKNVNDAWVCTNDVFRLALRNFG
ncbi:hypothetical protein P7K49_038601 [Saguinus oedipus]|uniref:Nuclear transport factor 2 domain-containing protein n=1 Tax=Saguinus oedipus TaxID=9490 RepID=A0ABQ9TFQ9_SAGOE|nr:hypothetical protein P7K49_038601 [Saguinus oedipus]